MTRDQTRDRTRDQSTAPSPRVLSSAGITAICVAVGAASLAATVAAGIHDGGRALAHPAYFAVLVVLLAYTHVRPTRLVHRHGSVESDHLDEALFVPIVLLLGPFEAAIAVTIASLAGNLAARRAPVKIIFNVGQTSLAFLAGYLVARAGGASVDSPVTGGAILACCIGGVVFAAASSFAVAAIVRMAAGHPLFAGMWEQVRTRGLASLGALMLGVVAGVAVRDNRYAALPAIALGWAVERSLVAIVIQRQARLAAEELQNAVLAVRNSSDPEQVLEELRIAARTVLHARTARLVDRSAPVPSSALRVQLEDGTALEVNDRVGSGVWLDSERDALNTLATVGGDVLRNARLLAHLTAITDVQTEGVLAVDAEGVVTFANPAAHRLLGHPDGLLGQVADAIFAIERSTGRIDLRTLADSHSGVRDDDAVLWAGATRTPISFTAAGLPAPQAGVVVVLHDITERKAFEEQLSYLAFHDPLTDLPNRRLFEDRLDHALRRAERQGTHHALLMVDLDRFKLVNDSYGHQTGDRLLVQVADRLRLALRPEDTCARLGGDEFAILIEDVESTEDAAAWADRIVEELSSGYAVDGHEMFVTASVGVALSDQVQTRAALVAAADVAAYDAKAAGRGRHHLFVPSAAEDSRARLELESALRRGLEHGEFEVYYQPIVDTVTGATVTAESLVRWNSPDGVVQPFKFIPLAEETGLIVPLGSWVLEEACRQGQAWREEHPERPPVRMSVNLSAHQLNRPQIVSEIGAILERTGFPPEKLSLEITETVIMSDAEAAIVTLRDLKALGLRIAIDDFGTGYSSLSYLKRFPVDVVKIDRSFINGLGDNAVDAEIVAAVIRLAAAAGITAVAEGVETEEQRRALAALGCPLIQGYLIAKPLNAAGFAQFWAERAPVPL